jgi:hypothetical protein
MRRLAALSAVLAAAATPATAQIINAEPTYFEAKAPLTEAEMKATFTGTYREDGTDVHGHDWTVQATADGSLRVDAGVYNDTGRAWLDGKKLCITYNKWKGDVRCYQYAHHGRQLASYGPDGKLDSVVTISR